MTVTDIRPGKHGLLYVHLDDEYAFSAYPDILYEFSIHKDSVLDDAALNALKEKQDLLWTRNRALDILGAADSSERALYDKLVSRGSSEAAAAAAVAFCKEHGFADDARLIRRLIPALFETKAYGIRRVRLYLSNKGFERPLIDEALAEYEPDSRGVICALLRKEPKENLADRKKLSKTIDRLMRRGFTYSDIRAALSEYAEIYPEDTDE